MIRWATTTNAKASSVTALVKSTSPSVAVSVFYEYRYSYAAAVRDGIEPFEYVVTDEFTDAVNAAKGCPGAPGGGTATGNGPAAPHPGWAPGPAEYP